MKLLRKFTALLLALCMKTQRLFLRKQCHRQWNMMDVASVLGISKAGAYTLAHSRDFPAFRVGRRIVISQEKFLDWLEKQSEQNSLT